jgi:chromate reductase
MDPLPTGKPDRVLWIVGIAGLRQGSFNRALLRAALELAPSPLRTTAHDLLPIPLYNADVEARGVPEAVTDLRNAMAADGLLIERPECNHGTPGVLKNAIDWLSRPPESSALGRKLAAIMGASPGMTGTARAQSQLRQAFVFTNTYAMTQSEILVARAHQKFDQTGTLIDQAMGGFLAMSPEAFSACVERFASS